MSVRKLAAVATAVLVAVLGASVPATAAPVSGSLRAATPAGISVKPLANGKANKKLVPFKGNPKKAGGVTTLATACTPNPCYIYNERSQSFSQPTNATGTSVSMTVAKPTMLSWDYHSLAEALVSNGTNRVEAGWTVDTALNGDSDPHLFVFWALSGAGQGYNTGDFLAAGGATIAPGDNINSLVGTSKVLQWEHFGAGCGCTQGWWLKWDGSFVGVYPDTLWSGAFTSPDFASHYGELVLDQTPSQSKMGNNHNATSANPAQGASFSSYTVLGTGAPAASYSAGVSTDGVRWPKYNNSSTEFHYGGPGGNDMLPSSTSPSSNDCAAQGVGTDPSGKGAACVYTGFSGGVGTTKSFQRDGGIGTACQNLGASPSAEHVANTTYFKLAFWPTTNCTGAGFIVHNTGQFTFAAGFRNTASLSMSITTTPTTCATGYPGTKPTC